MFSFSFFMRVNLYWQSLSWNCNSRLLCFYVAVVWRRGGGGRGGGEADDLSSSVSITVAVFIFSAWLKLDFIVKFPVG